MSQQQIDECVHEYLQFRGFKDLAQQFLERAKQPDMFQDVSKTFKELITLAKQGNFDELYVKFSKFYDIFIRNNKNIQETSQLVQIELYKLCLYNMILHKQPICDAIQLLQRKFINEFNVYTQDKNLRKEQSVNCYANDVVVETIENQLRNLVSYAFSNRRLPQIYSLIGNDIEKVQLLSEVQMMRNCMENMKEQIEANAKSTMDNIVNIQ